jgi:tetratricopeptide (TPR) repeat protein
LKQGRVLYESGQPKDAREKFLEVLAIDENEGTARAYLHRIEDDLSRPSASYDLAAATPAGDVLAEEDEPGGAPALAAEMPSRQTSRPKAAPRRVSAVLVIGLLAAIGAALFLMLRPRGSAPPPPASASPAGNPIGEATRLFQEGKVDEARQALLAIPASSPQYGRAQKMLATFGPAASPSPGETAATASSATAAPATPPPASAEAQRKEAETALAEHRYIAALSGFHQSAPRYPGDAELKKEMAEATVKVQEISPAVRLFNDGDYDSALPILWRLYQADHQNFDVKSYLVRCYYNQGVIALQNNLFDKAAKAFGDALGVQPDDALSRRQKSFAERYAKRPPDLLARVYLKYLRPRP